MRHVLIMFDTRVTHNDSLEVSQNLETDPDPDAVCKQLGTVLQIEMHH